MPNKDLNGSVLETGISCSYSIFVKEQAKT